MTARAQGQTTATRSLQVLFVAALGLAFVGLVVGIRQGATVPELTPPERDGPSAHSDALPSTAYRDFDRRSLGPNWNWSVTLADLKQPEIDLFAERQSGTDEMRRVLLATRAERRAFDGAPPVVPHPIDQVGTAGCLACHEHGYYVGKQRFAPMMSHIYMPNCTQCHVESQSRDLAPFVLAGNSFEGKAAPVRGQRAWMGAPPTVPHTTLMRDNCLSCHGPMGASPIQTTHPWRVNCLQCHAPSSEFNQVAPHSPLQWLQMDLRVDR